MKSNTQRQKVIKSPHKNEKIAYCDRRVRYNYISRFRSNWAIPDESGHFTDSGTFPGQILMRYSVFKSLTVQRNSVRLAVHIVI